MSRQAKPLLSRGLTRAVWHSSPFAGKRKDSHKWQFLKDRKVVSSGYGQAFYDFNLVVRALQTLRGKSGTLISSWTPTGKSWDEQIDDYRQLIMQDGSSWSRHTSDIKAHMSELKDYNRGDYHPYHDGMDERQIEVWRYIQNR